MYPFKTCEQKISGKRNLIRYALPFTRFLALTSVAILTYIPCISETPPTNAQKKGGPTMLAQFTQASIQIDGIAEPAWSDASAHRISIAMVADLSGVASDCSTYGEVRSLWNGAMIYFLIDVNDTNLTAAAEKPTDKDGVEIFLDLWNDKFPKYEEDDGLIRISSGGQVTGSGAYVERLRSYATAVRYEKNTTIGYTIELAIHSGGIPIKNGSSLGIDFGINDALSSTNSCQYRIFRSNGKNKGLNDSSGWGNVVLSGYNGKEPMALDTFIISSNLKKASKITRGIWVNEAELDLAIAEANAALTENNAIENRCRQHNT